ncbi:helix-turn-helix transcriptional regulator [Streptomyces qinzhouensis]|uniref:Helix-turn-helix transcriptional regulator n=1 Tax=Streptomyces qinzhouensis TaxID=2599401 RepID=A0A5B8IQQ2_9ACTN|nr:helix-turn-helix transcriptional regulator [Streptomyces qinzhouensis]QDY79939.1 helix-turn-helix transcriptional regulator [Streptomyces qinzhouensis]
MASFREIERRTLAAVAELGRAGLPLDEFFLRVHGLLRPVLGYDAGCWHGADPVTGFLTSTVSGDLPPGGFEQAVHLEAWSDDPTRFASIREAGRLADSVHRATGGHPERSIRYRELLHELDFEDELRLNLDAQGGRWGAAALMRAGGARPFGPRELRFAERAARAVAVVLRDITTAAPGPGTVPGPDGPPAVPAVLLIGPSGRLVSADPGAQRLLAALDEEMTRPAGVPTAVVMVAQWARAGAAGGGTAPGACARLRGPKGEWLSLHASLLDGRADGHVAVVAQPASPTEVMPLALLAHKLSDREQEVALQAVRGSSTREIALALFLTPATVQDHLKSVFTKTGVRSRRELVALLTASHATSLRRPPEVVPLGVPASRTG